MKKIALCCLLALTLCLAYGCGNDGAKQRLKTGEEQALEQKEKAEEAVDAVNEQSNQMIQDATAIDTE